jgi:hypothetical protein
MLNTEAVVAHVQLNDVLLCFAETPISSRNGMPWGYMTATAVLNMADTAMELMASVNLIAIRLLSGTIAKLTEDYVDKKRRLQAVLRSGRGQEVCVSNEKLPP